MTESNERKEGAQFVPSQESVQQPKSREAKHFVPADVEQLKSAPDAIAANETTEHLPTYSGLYLEKLPWRGLKFLLVSTFLLVLVLAGWQVSEVFVKAYALHWLLGGVFLLLVAGISLSALLVAGQFIYGRQLAGKPEQLQAQAARIQEGQDKGSAKPFIEQLQEHYRDKPQGIFLARALANLPDYSTDKEALLHLERSFLEPLDKEAARRVSQFSLQTAVAVTLSPWAFMDMALALWRMVKMVDEVAQVYGIRPSLMGRWRLMRNIAVQLVYVGASEVAMEHYFDEISNDAIGGLLAARGLQGLGAGVYSVRVGICAMKLCRPIAFSVGKTPRFKAVAADMLGELKSMLKRCV